LKTVLSLADFPLNIYICINKNDVKNLKAGLYQYKSEINKLKILESQGLKNNLIENLELKGIVPVIFIITADIDKLMQEREKVFFELGEVTANILLKTRELKLVIKVIDEFDDEKITDLIDLDDQQPLLFIITGVSIYKL
jgi:SagB-type dehydrogenase family enzyme